MTVAEYDAETVAKHRSNNDIWTSIHGKVYNITKFLTDHPGGEEVLTDIAGTDSTEAFEDVGHSEDARELLKKFYIGDLKATSATTSKSKTTVPDPVVISKDRNTTNASTFLWMSVCVVAVGAVWAYSRF